MVDRVSALKGHYEPGRFGEPGEPGVRFKEVRGLTLWQIAAWPDSIDAVGVQVAGMAGVQAAPGPGKAVVAARGSLLRVEPLKWWLHGVAAHELDPEQGATLDLSHSRTHLRVAGPQAQACLNRLVSVDLRKRSFPSGSVAVTVMHHVGVTVWRSDHGFELFLPRGFAAALWIVLRDTAVQFGVEVE